MLVIGVGAVLGLGAIVVIVAIVSKRDVQMVDFAPKPAGATSVVGLLREGRKIEAIKLYREQTGVGLAEAKAAVEAMDRGEPVAAPPGPEASVEALVAAGRTIDAIKRYREQTGASLADAKAAIDALAAGGELPKPKPRTITSEMAIDDAELRGHMSAGRMIDAIKRYRELTGLGLKEAKDAVEALRAAYKS